jgi:hypothetical protein
VAEVRAAELGSWRGNYNRMFLPELFSEQDGMPHGAAYFDSSYPVSPEQLGGGRRIACLSDLGINLLL